MDIFSSLTKNEITVLYWKCKGLKHDQIAARLGYSKDWVQLQVSTVYSKLGFDKSMHWTKRVEILEKEICPLLPKDIKDLDKLQSVTGETPALEPEVITPDPEMMALVLYDEKQIEEVKNKAITPPRQEVIVIPPIKGPSCLERVVRYAVFLTVAAVVVVVAYFIGRGAIPAPVVLVITATPVPATETPLSTATPVFTETPLPTPTFTPAPTNTPIPTATDKGYYDEGETVLLADGVYAYINENFQTGGNPCWKPDNGFALVVIIENTSNNPYLIRFDATGFHAKDDLGNNYKLLGSDIFYCQEKVGIIEGQLRGGNKTNIGMQFEGIIPLNATYVDITIDFISGVGPITFRKYIY